MDLGLITTTGPIEHGLWPRLSAEGRTATFCLWGVPTQLLHVVQRFAYMWPNSPRRSVALRTLIFLPETVLFDGGE
jgi:hypothetical protein